MESSRISELASCHAKSLVHLINISPSQTLNDYVGSHHCFNVLSNLTLNVGTTIIPE